MQLKIILFAVTFIVGVKIASTGGDGEENGSKTFKVIPKCAKDFSVSGDDAKGMISGNFSAITENIQCFVKCVMVGMDEMNENDDNDFKPEVMIGKLMKIFSPENAEGSTNKCEKITKDSSCQEAYNIFKCLRESRKKQ